DASRRPPRQGQRGGQVQSANRWMLVNTVSEITFRSGEEEQRVLPPLRLGEGAQKRGFELRLTPPAQGVVLPCGRRPSRTPQRPVPVPVFRPPLAAAAAPARWRSVPTVPA